MYSTVQHNTVHAYTVLVYEILTKYSKSTYTHVRSIPNNLKYCNCTIPGTIITHSMLSFTILYAIMSTPTETRVHSLCTEYTYYSIAIIYTQQNDIHCKYCI